MIYLVRHGEAAAGWGHAKDPGLSSLGRQQAAAVGEQLSTMGFKHGFASPMTRCQETSQPFSLKTGIEIATEPNVSEIPTVQGLDDRISWLQNFMSGTWDNAEPILHDWRSALISTMEALPDHSVVFTHFVAINTIVGHLEGSQLVTSFRPGYCSMTKLVRGSSGLTVRELGSESATRVL